MTHNSSHETVKHETRLAVLNGLRILAALCVTLTIAILIRSWVPRSLGPEWYGRLNFAESFATGWFAFSTLGMGVHISKEVATDKSYGSRIWGGTLVTQAGMGLLMCGGMAVTLYVMDRDHYDWQVVGIFAATRFLAVANGTLVALLLAVGEARELSWYRTVSKVAWAIIIVVGLHLGGSVRTIAAAFFITELGKTPLLYRACVRHLALRFSWQPHEVFEGLKTSLPYYLHLVAHKIYGSVDVTMLAWLINDEEVGWYGAARNVPLLALIAIPALNAVLLPMSSRIREQSEEALNATMRAASRAVLMVSFPVTLMTVLVADSIVLLLFGEDYLPAVTTLRVLSLMMPLTAMLTIASPHLYQLGRPWVPAASALVAMVLNPAMNFVLIPWAAEKLGPGGAGLAAAAASVTTELLIAAHLFGTLGRAGVDRETVLLFGRLGLAGAITYAVHSTQILPGMWMVIPNGLTYVVVGAAVGALPLGLVVERVRGVLKRRGL